MMIASYIHKWIFIKTRKTGSTSLEIVLSSWCARRDICTPISNEDESIRNQFGGSARNHLGRWGGARFYNHMPATEVRRKLPLLWRRATSFAVERHPYEKVVSLAWFQLGQRGLDGSHIHKEINEVIANRLYLNHPLYASKGRVIVDQLWDYPDAWERLAELASTLGLPLPSELPRAKSKFRQDPRPAREILNEQQRAQIAHDAHVEFELMRYRP
jgi:hypothetical protein